MKTIHLRGGQRSASPRAQRGAALMVAMIMVFMLSLLGVSSMRSSSMEQRMAVNSILASDVLQSAESANELILNDMDNLAATFLAPGQRLTFDDPLDSDDETHVFSTEVTLSYAGEGNPLGASLDASQGGNSFDRLYYVATGSARLDGVRADRQIDQGAYRNVPSDSTD